MLREWLSGAVLLDLPIVAMLLFLLMFVMVLWRVVVRRRSADYQAMAALPLADDTAERILQ